MTEKSVAEGMSRRTFAKRTAVASAAAWAVPTIVTLRPAGAQELTSPPPEPPEPPENVDSVMGRAPQILEVSAPRTSASPSTRGVLAQTGADVEELTAAGLGAIAVGASLRLWQADIERRKTPSSGVDERTVERGLQPTHPVPSH